MPEKDDPESKPGQRLRLVKSNAAEGELLSSVASGSAAQIVLAVTAVVAICYVAKLPLITLLLAILVAFMLDPLVAGMQQLRIPRWAGSFIAVALLLGCLYGAAHFSYNRAVEFIDQLPRYSRNIEEATLRFRQQAEKLRRSTESVLPNAAEDNQVVTVKEQSNLSAWIISGFGGFTEVLLSLSFIPFLVYFMLSWRDKTRDSTVRLFDPANRKRAIVALSGIAGVMRGFLVGNFICGLFLTVVSAIVFGFLELPYFYFLALISGFLSLLPYLGVVFAIIPPIAAGIGQLSGTQMVVVAAVVIGLHVFAINVLFPKVIGKRLRLNPLVVTIALLLWGWLWGAMGLILAVPITSALKIVFDHIESLRPFGEWMED
jgi:predicted PurR-regulated permease PerM